MKEIPWGPVAIIKGKYKGTIGYYEDDSPSGKTAFVYLAVNPWAEQSSEYAWIKHDFLEPVTSLEFEKAKKECPGLEQL